MDEIILTMTALEKKRKETELLQVKAATAGLELKVLELEEQIHRVQEHIKIQKAREGELEKELGSK